MFFKFSNLNQNSLASNSFYLYISHFADYLLALIFLPFIAKTVGALEFGMIGLAQTFGILITLIIEFGSSLDATRKVSRIRGDKGNLKSFISSITVSKFLLIPITVLISIFTILFVPVFNSNPNYVIIVLIGGIFQGFAPTWYFQGMEKMKSIALSKIIFRLLGFLVIFFFVSKPNNAWIVLASFAGSSALICLYLYFLIVKEFGLFHLQFSNTSLIIFKKSIFSFCITILPMIYQNITLITLSIIANPIQLGYVYGANRIYRAFNNLFGPFSQAFMPIISSVHEKNKNQSKLLMKNYLFFMTFFGLLLLLINFFFAESIVALFLGSDYYFSIELLKIFSIVLPLTAISNAIGRQWLIANNKDFFYFLSQLLSLSIAFFIFLFFIKSLGAKAFPISLIFFESITIIMILVFLVINRDKA